MPSCIHCGHCLLIAFHLILHYVNIKQQQHNVPNINLYSCYESFVRAANKRKTGFVHGAAEAPVMKGEAAASCQNE